MNDLIRNYIDAITFYHLNKSEVCRLRVKELTEELNTCSIRQQDLFYANVSIDTISVQ